MMKENIALLIKCINDFFIVADKSVDVDLLDDFEANFNCLGLSLQEFNETSLVPVNCLEKVNNFFLYKSTDSGGFKFKSIKLSVNDGY